MTINELPNGNKFGDALSNQSGFLIISKICGWGEYCNIELGIILIKIALFTIFA